MLIDTHCHLDFDEFNSDRSEIIERAKKAGVLYFINVASSLEGSRKSVELASGDDNIFASVGIHPHHALDVDEGAFPELRELAKNKKVIAIGEVGLDFYRNLSPPDRQKELFTKFIGLSKELRLPLIIHNRDAQKDTLDILKNTCEKPIRGVMHCFSGDKKFLDDVLELGLFVSFTCNLTFKNARSLREVARLVPADRLLLETDAPFLAPEAMRGKRNEPAYMMELRDMLSGLLDMPKEKLETITTDNAEKLFNLHIKK